MDGNARSKRSIVRKDSRDQKVIRCYIFVKLPKDAARMLNNTFYSTIVDSNDSFLNKLPYVLLINALAISV